MNMFADERLDLDAMLWLIPDVRKPHSTNEQINEFLGVFRRAVANA